MRPRLLLGILTVAALAAVMAPPVLMPAPRIVYNPSASAPRGWYAVHPSTEPRAGDLVLARLPAEAAALAAARGYLPLGLPVVKRVAATAGDCVCAAPGVIVINARASVTTRAADGAGRPLGAWTGCRQLDAGEVFLLGDRSPASFDSRYFGPVGRSAIVGALTPVWTW